MVFAADFASLKVVFLARSVEPAASVHPDWKRVSTAEQAKAVAREARGTPVLVVAKTVPLFVQTLKTTNLYCALWNPLADESRLLHQALLWRQLRETSRFEGLTIFPDGDFGDGLTTSLCDMVTHAEGDVAFQLLVYIAALQRFLPDAEHEYFLEASRRVCPDWTQDLPTPSAFATPFAFLRMLQETPNDAVWLQYTPKLDEIDTRLASEDACQADRNFERRLHAETLYELVQTVVDIQDSRTPPRARAPPPLYTFGAAGPNATLDWPSVFCTLMDAACDPTVATEARLHLLCAIDGVISNLNLPAGETAAWFAGYADPQALVVLAEMDCDALSTGGNDEDGERDQSDCSDIELGSEGEEDDSYDEDDESDYDPRKGDISEAESIGLGFGGDSDAESESSPSSSEDEAEAVFTPEREVPQRLKRVGVYVDREDAPPKFRRLVQCSDDDSADSECAYVGSEPATPTRPVCAAADSTPVDTGESTVVGLRESVSPALCCAPDQDCFSPECHFFQQHDTEF
jgi:hypothetical protein